MKFEFNKMTAAAGKVAAIALGALVISAGVAAAQGNGNNAPSGQAGTTTTQNVNVVNTPTVTVGNSVNIATLPGVTISGTPTVNIASMPQVKDAEKLARIPYEEQIFNGACVSGACLATLSGAPSGYRLVVQNVTGFFQLTSGATAAPMVEFWTQSGPYLGSPTNHWGLVGKVGPTVGSYTMAGSNDQILSYSDGVNGGIAVQIYGPFASTGQQRVTITGYLENCSVTGCPAIQ